jgi:hypothetical protein
LSLPFFLALGVPGALLAGMAEHRATPSMGEPPDSMRVEIVIPAKVAVGQPVPVTLRISNTSDRPIDLYLQGRPLAFDLIVQRGTQVVWRRLEGATVSAILQIRTLAPGEALELKETWKSEDSAGRRVDPGDYTVSGSVLTDREPLRTGPAPLRISG